MRRSGLTCAVAIVLSTLPAAAALAGSVYDGAWNLVFVTQRGECDPSYSFGVNIANGIVSHPNLVRSTGRVTTNGIVRASVTVQDKYAAGSGKLTKTSGQAFGKVAPEAPVVSDIGQHRNPDVSALWEGFGGPRASNFLAARWARRAGDGPDA